MWQYSACVYHALTRVCVPVRPSRRYARYLIKFSQCSNLTRWPHCFCNVVKCTLKYLKIHHEKTVYSECLLRLVLRFSCCSRCSFLYGPFGHGAFKLDLSTLFVTIFIWISLQFILFQNKNLPEQKNVLCQYVL